MEGDEIAHVFDRLTDDQSEYLFDNVHGSGIMSNDWDDGERSEFYDILFKMDASAVDSLAGVSPFIQAGMPNRKTGRVFGQVQKVIDKGDDAAISNGELNDIKKHIGTLDGDEIGYLFRNLTDLQKRRMFDNVHGSGVMSNDWDDGERAEFYDILRKQDQESRQQLFSSLDPATSYYKNIQEQLSAGALPKPALSQILNDFQVEEDPGGVISWGPKMDTSSGPVPLPGSFDLTKREADILDEHVSSLVSLWKFKNIYDKSFDEATARYEPTVRKITLKDGTEDIATGNYDHNDAFRHAYWSSLLTKEFGVDFARAYTQAHEGIPGNPADMEAMDLYNNETGIQIAAQNPAASDEELADLIDNSISRGDLVVMPGDSGQLAYSDEVAVGATGKTDNEVYNVGRKPIGIDPSS